MTITLRHIDPADYDPLIAVVDGWWGGRPMQAMLPRLFFTHFRDTSFVAEVDGAIRGFLVGFLSPTYPDQAYVHFIGVDPAARGLQVGRALYERFFAVAAAAGRSELCCVTSPLNHASLAFHRRLGFTPLPGPAEKDGVPFTPDYDGPGEDRVRFSRRL